MKDAKFSVVIIRLNNDTKVFENTEMNNIMSLREVEDEMLRDNCAFSQFKSILDLDVLQSKIIESKTLTNQEEKAGIGTRFIYIRRIN